MRRNGYRVIAKDLVQLPDGSKKANLDVEIAVDMMALVDSYDTAVLVSGDGDLAYAVNSVSYRGVRVEVVSLRSMTSDSLINVTRSTDDKIIISSSASASTRILANIDNSANYVLDLFDSTVYRSAKYLYTAKTTTYTSGGPHFASGEILVMHDGANTYITQYAMLSSSADDIVTVSTDINNSNVRLLANATLGGTIATVRLTGITYTEI
jgi:hypothetical protein